MDRAVPQAPANVERFVKQLYVTSKSVKLYPTSNAIPRDNAEETIGLLRTLLERQPEVRLSVSKDGLTYEGLPVSPKQSAYASFAREFYSRNLSDIRFHAGTTVNDVLSFLGLLLVTPENLSNAGGFEQRLWDLQVDNITVKEIASKIVDTTSDDISDVPTAEQDAAWPPPFGEIDDLLVGVFGGKSRDRRILLRFIETPQLVREYLAQSTLSGGSSSHPAWMANRVAALSRVVQTELPDDQAAHHRSLAEAVMGLDAEDRRTLLADKLLAGARHDAAMMAVVSQLTLDEVCEALVDGLEQTNESRLGLTRALHNLIRIGMGGREEVIGTAVSAMQKVGIEEAFVSAVVGEAAPQRLKVEQSRRPGADQQPIDGILKLVDLAATARTAQVDNETELSALREEARRGVTDGDVLGSLVAVATIEEREDEFASIMSLLEDSVGLLVERQEFAVGSRTADALMKAFEDPKRSEAQRGRVMTVISALTDKRSIRTITQAMRLYPVSSEEHRACHALLTTLGEHAIEPLLEVLAEEPDMGARKAIVDLIAGMAAGHVAKLGSCLGDSRWYFVRNVISIMATTHDPAVVPYLQRTLRHSDARVRRETIRAVAGVRDALAGQMLLASLVDDDAQNVQLAARYLGASKWRGAVVGLSQVASGQGSGNRDMGARIEAIEALGAIGAAEAVPTLEQLAKQRGLLGRARSREVRAAAEAALAAIRGAKKA